MNILSVEEYIRFECIGGSCPISCCGGDWSIIVDDRAKELYQSVEGEFGDRLRNGTTVIDGTTVFKLDENRDCVFLNENRLCSIYREIGADKLCETCKTYPRTFYQVGDLLFHFLANSCPEVTRMVLQKIEPMNTLYDDSEESDADSRDQEKEFNRKEFDYALKALSVGIHIIQNREILLRDRLILLLLYISRFQEIMQEGLDPSDLTGLFSMPEAYTLFLENNPVTDRDYITKIRAFKLIFGFMMNKSYSHPMWKNCNELAAIIAEKGICDLEALEKAYDRVNDAELQIEQEQLIAYRFFVVFMTGFDNTDYLDKIAYELVLFAALTTYMSLTEVMQDHICTQEERILFYSLSSRIEHSEKRRKELEKKFTDEGFCELEMLLKLVS